jgi:hypothetical protein
VCSPAESRREKWQSIGSRSVSIDDPEIKDSTPRSQVIVDAGRLRVPSELPFNIAREAISEMDVDAAFSCRPVSKDEKEPYVAIEPATKSEETSATSAYSTISANNYAAFVPI